MISDTARCTVAILADLALLTMAWTFSIQTVDATSITWFMTGPLISLGAMLIGMTVAGLVLLWLCIQEFRGSAHDLGSTEHHAAA